MAAANEHLRAARRQPGEAAEATPCGGCGCADDQGPGEEAPDWREHLDPAAAPRLDVRPMLAAGEGPFAVVMQMADGVPPAGVLVIEAPFDPQPLRQVLASRGFSTYGERLGPGHWQIWCRRCQPGDDPPPVQQAECAPREAQIWRSGDVVHIDVRGLEAPRPLVAILTLIDGASNQGHIVVHHDRDPLYLYPELEERGWRYARLPSPGDEVRLELRGPH